jgi:hypothetical protein
MDGIISVLLIRMADYFPFLGGISELLAQKRQRGLLNLNP